MDRAEIVHEAFARRVASGDLPVPNRPSADLGVSPDLLISLFKAQVMSRQLDRMSRKLQARGQGFYTIGSSGHEGSAAIAYALRPTDPAFLHYRDAAFQIARADQAGHQTVLMDMLLSFTASSEDPISGGRHKVLGSKQLNIPPQTSTIASHLPKALGAAYGIALGRRDAKIDQVYPSDAIVLCSFGDASLNHSTAQGALNAAGWTHRQGAELPLLFLCEDNGIGISTKSPAGWVQDVLQSRPDIRCFACDGLDIADSFATAQVAADYVRKKRKPAVLHIRCVRLFGHAGPDVEAAYLPNTDIAAAERDDPLAHTAGRLIHETTQSPADVIALYNTIGDAVETQAEKAVTRPKLQNATEVMASLIPPIRNAGEPAKLSVAARAQVFGSSDMRALSTPQPLNKSINLALTDLMMERPDIVMVGEDIGKKGGVYGVTKSLQSRFGAGRVTDSLLDEQSILGLSIGLAQTGFLPIPEIQFLAYLHNTEDQLRGEAATLSFFLNGQFTNPMIVRIAGLGYQKGFGGHFHNDNSLAVLRDIPGLIIGCPSSGPDAVRMYREAVRLAKTEQRVVVMIEPIALYATRDLLNDGDGAWCGRYPAADESAALGQVGVTGQGTDLAIVTYGNGAYLSRQAQSDLADKGIDARVIDLRWLAPLDYTAIFEAVGASKHVMIVDECRKTGAQAWEICSMFFKEGWRSVEVITAKDSFIATGPAYGATLPSRDEIVDTALRQVKAANA